MSPKNLKEEFLSRDQTITKQLYIDCSRFRNAIFQNIQDNNPDHDKLTLFRKTQKLLNRFLFLFFGEGRSLLPPDSIHKIAKQWSTLSKQDAYQPLYTRYKKYFGYLNTGHKGRYYDIFPYNGGLFAPDSVLDRLKIDDAVLFTHIKRLNTYDFEREVSASILSHILELSLNDIEEIQTEIEEEKSRDEQVRPRRKDGQFYIPRDMTKYIVDHTVGSLCAAKKRELELLESELEHERRGEHQGKIQHLLVKLKSYRQWLLGLKICDTVCGRGALLNQVLDFLIEEHQYIDELQNKLPGNYIPLSNIENSILEHNIYGVDVNEESVEIAKLSLWFRTAEKGRKLTSLHDNIKCRNSLIDEPLIAGDKAFNWYESFPQVFQPKEKLGYHVVWTTHNSRTSPRMIKYNVQKGDPIELNLPEEISLTKIIGKIIVENGYNCLAYNICTDHVHMILVCEGNELDGIMQKMKSISSKEVHRLITRPRGQDQDPLAMGRDPLDQSMRSHDPAEHGNHLWSQKYFHADLQEWKVASVSHRPGHVYDDGYLWTAMAYIQSNREKHGLPDSPELRSIIKSFTRNLEEVFEMEYKGGFDVVIGKPIYEIRSLGPRKEKSSGRIFQFFRSQADFCLACIEREFNLVNKKGYLSLILPKSWMKNTMMSSSRKFILESFSVKSILSIMTNFFDGFSDDAMVLIRGKKQTGNGNENAEYKERRVGIKHTVNPCRFYK